MSAPRVESVRARGWTVPTDAPEGDGTLAWDSTTLVVVEATAGATTGLGWTYAPAAAAAVVEELLAGVVTGTDPMAVPATSQAMVRAVRNAGRPGLVSEAVSAVDVALWDLKARLLGLPPHVLLGSDRSGVPVYGRGGFTTYDRERTERQVAAWLDAGVGAVKIKVGESWGREQARDVARIREVRALLPPEVELFVDANGGYTRKQAVRVMREVAGAGVTWLEEPVSSDDLAGLQQVRAAVDADVTAGEYGYDLTYFRRMCEAGAVDCLQADVSRCGGITEWLRVAACAAAYGLDVSGHCAPHLHAAVAASVPNLRHLEWFHDHVRIEAMAFDGAGAVRGGELPLGTGPGLGLTLKEADLEEHRVA